MGYYSHINGIIYGIEPDLFKIHKTAIENGFVDSVDYDLISKTLSISSYGKHYDEWTYPAYDAIAKCIVNPNNCGELEYEGEEPGHLAKIYFGRGGWEEVYPEITWPKNPFDKSREEEFTMLKSPSNLT